MKIQDYGLQATENCVFAVSVDIPRLTERILVGEESEVRKAIEGASDPALLYMTQRSLGLLLQDFAPAPIRVADVRAALLDSMGRKKSAFFPQAVSALREMTESGNPVHRFVAAQMWQEFGCASRDKAAVASALDMFDDITLAIRYDVVADVLLRQRESRARPLAHLGAEFRSCPVSVYYEPDAAASEWGAVSGSLLPLLAFYLKRIYDGDRYVQVCPVCGKAFAAKTAGRTTLCSAACKRERVRLNKKRFDEKARRLSYERASKNAYMYWYNKVKKLVAGGDAPKRVVRKIETEFAAFTKEANLRKRGVVSGRTGAAEYEAWLLEMRDRIDDLVGAL